MRVAVVILNWNGKSFLEKFLPSLFNSLPDYAELIIADNASTDGSAEASTLNDRIQWIQLDKNYGFTGGYNRAFAQIKKQAEYNYYVLINSDILAIDRWLEPIVDFMESHPEVAACQPKILSYNHHQEGIEQFEYAGASGGFIDKWGFPLCRGRILSSVENDCGQYDTPSRCFWASGACMVVRTSIWHLLSGLEEKFFAHMEEIDFCWRAANAGYQVWCLPQSKVYHVGGGTLPNNSPRKLYLNYRNNLLMLWKNLPKKHRNTKIFLRKCIDGLSAVCYIFQGKFSYFKSVMKAHRDYSRMKGETELSPSPSPSASESKKQALPYGMLPFSIILKFFTGHKKFSQL
ncbi:MAG: glycosyltransferase family 2 protein [Bacteroidales bacterium]|nr:glycosyltransferase family 2 protein [Bacteroidales bacterium]